jgi:hypothetical protein
VVAQRLGAFSSRPFDGSQCFHVHCCPHSHSDTAADPRRLESSLYAYSELFLHEDTEVSAENQQVAKDKLTVVLSVNTYPVLSCTVIFSTLLTGAATDFHPIPDKSVRILATYSLRFMFTLFRHLCLGLSCFITPLPSPLTFSVQFSSLPLVQNSPGSFLNIEAVSFSETLVSIYQTTRRHIPQFSELPANHNFF